MLAGLEILSKVFDQQSSPMVSKILQQVSGAQRYGGANPHPGSRPHGPAMAPSMGICGAGSPILPLWSGSGGSHPALTHGARGVLPCSVVLRGGPSLLGRGDGSRVPILLCCTVLGGGDPSLLGCWDGSEGPVLPCLLVVMGSYPAEVLC